MSSPGYFLALSILLLAVTTDLQPYPGCAAAREFPAGANSPAKPQAPVAVGTTTPAAGTNANHTTTPAGGEEGQYMDLKGECAPRGGCNVPGVPTRRYPTFPPRVAGSLPRSSSVWGAIGNMWRRIIHGQK